MATLVIDDEGDPEEEAKPRVIKQLSATVTIQLEDEDDYMVDYYCEVIEARLWSVRVRVQGRTVWLPRQKILITKQAGRHSLFLPRSLADEKGLD